MRALLVCPLALISACTLVLDVPDPDLEEGGTPRDTRLGRRPADLVAIRNDSGTTSFDLYSSAPPKTFELPRTAKTQDGWGDDAIWLVGAFDDDPLDDLVEIRDDTEPCSLGVRLSTDASFGPVATWGTCESAWSETTRWIAGDFDGDWLGDVAAVRMDPLTITVYRSYGSGFHSPVTWSVADAHRYTAGRWGVGYFDRDHRADLVVAWNDGGHTSIDVLRSTGTSFAATTWAERTVVWADRTLWLPGDFDADGLDDVAAAWDDEGQIGVHMFPSRGAAFGAVERWTPNSPGGWTGSRWTVADFDADRDADLAVAWEEGRANTLTVRDSLHDGGSRQLGHDHWALGVGTWSPTAVWVAGSFDAK
jgi:hypothetical protein